MLNFLNSASHEYMKSPTFIAYVSKDHVAICAKVLLVNVITQSVTQLLANLHRTNSGGEFQSRHSYRCEGGNSGFSYD